MDCTDHRFRRGTMSISRINSGEVQKMPNILMVLGDSQAEAEAENY